MIEHGLMWGYLILNIGWICAAIGARFLGDRIFAAKRRRVRQVDENAALTLRIDDPFNCDWLLEGAGFLRLIAIPFQPLIAFPEVRRYWTEIRFAFCPWAAGITVMLCGVLLMALSAVLH